MTSLIQIYGEEAVKKWEEGRNINKQVSKEEVEENPKPKKK